MNELAMKTKGQGPFAKNKRHWAKPEKVFPQFFVAEPEGEKTVTLCCKTPDIKAGIMMHSQKHVWAHGSECAFGRLVSGSVPENARLFSMSKGGKRPLGLALEVGDVEEVGMSIWRSRCCRRKALREFTSGLRRL